MHMNSQMPRQSHKIDDDDLDEETGIEMADDSEIKADHNMKETGSLLGRVVGRKKKSCIHSTCRIMMGIVATAVFCFMLIQLWSNYGDDIKKRVFSPQISGAGTFGEKGANGDLFGMKFHKWDNTTLHINMSKPKNDLVQINILTPQAIMYEWVDECLRITLERVDQVTLMVWSI